MKTNRSPSLLIPVLLTFAFVLPCEVFAQTSTPPVQVTSVSASGGETGGGGDIQCDALTKKITSNIEEWISENGPEVGHLDLSSSLNPLSGHSYTYAEYSSAMSTLLKLPLDASCVSQGDQGYPVSVDGSSKICRNRVDTTGIHMICDRSLFMALAPDLQIEQIHHEFAIDVPGLEPDTGPISTYKISTQLSQSTENVVERKLVVHKNYKTFCYQPLPSNQINLFSGMELISLTYWGQGRLTARLVCNNSRYGNYLYDADTNANFVIPYAPECNKIESSMRGNMSSAFLFTVDSLTSKVVDVKRQQACPRPADAPTLGL